MKKIIIILSIIGCFTTWNLHAQRIIWQDDFETSKGWSEYEDESGNAIIKDGTLIIKSKEGWTYFSRCKTNLDGNKNFTISADVNPKKELIFGHKIGIIFDYSDGKNYMAFYVERGFVRFIQYKDGQLVREEKDYLKGHGKKLHIIKTKEETHLTFEIQKKGQSVIFLVNNEETLEMDGITVNSNRIGFMVSGKQEVAFDNVKIYQ
jgi:hypothetical protein